MKIIIEITEKDIAALAQCLHGQRNLELEADGKAIAEAAWTAIHGKPQAPATQE